ncbi:hypothetical protein VKT23_008516 [Stygiomarasmius scandens]|uniref:Cyanovirin-N domain-containing protein n=1 Tax=Marasmiellus scandens TaxID=2682957 RepID=A0ABR1JKX6_9AGAR
MSFANARSPRLVGNNRLTVKCEDSQGQEVNPVIDLNLHLGNEGGSFKWGGRNFYHQDTVRKLDLNGSILRAELKNGDAWVPAEVDLSTYIHVKDSKLQYFGPDDSNESSPPPPYARGSFREYRKRTESTRSMSRTSSYFQYKVNSEELLLSGSMLLYGSSSPIQLDDYIGIEKGKLIWGGTGFFKTCGGSGHVSLNAYILVVDFENDKLELDLTPYLQFHNDKMTLKVTGSNNDLSRMLSEARWMKFKVVTEPDINGASIEGASFKAAVHSIEATSRHIVTEMTEELIELGSQDILATVSDRLKEKVTDGVGQGLAIAMPKPNVVDRREVLATTYMLAVYYTVT